MATVAGWWSMEGDAGAARFKPVCDVPTQLLKLPGSIAQVILPLLGQSAEIDGQCGWPRTAIPICLQVQ